MRIKQFTFSSSIVGPESTYPSLVAMATVSHGAPLQLMTNGSQQQSGYQLLDFLHQLYLLGEVHVDVHSYTEQVQ